MSFVPHFLGLTVLCTNISKCISIFLKTKYMKNLDLLITHERRILRMHIKINKIKNNFLINTNQNLIMDK
jgi:hypothetical protein